jgi:hypothetical protein
LRRSSVVFCRNLRICDLRINHKKLRVCDLRTNTPKKFADLRLRNEPKNLRNGDLRTLKMIACPPLLTILRGRMASLD